MPHLRPSSIFPMERFWKSGELRGQVDQLLEEHIQDKGVLTSRVHTQRASCRFCGDRWNKMARHDQIPSSPGFKSNLKWPCLLVTGVWPFHFTGFGLCQSTSNSYTGMTNSARFLPCFIKVQMFHCGTNTHGDTRQASFTGPH